MLPGGRRASQIAVPGKFRSAPANRRAQNASRTVVHRVKQQFFGCSGRSAAQRARLSGGTGEFMITRMPRARDGAAGPERTGPRRITPRSRVAGAPGRRRRARPADRLVDHAASRGGVGDHRSGRRRSGVSAVLREAARPGFARGRGGFEFAAQCGADHLLQQRGGLVQAVVRKLVDQLVQQGPLVLHAASIGDDHQVVQIGQCRSECGDQGVRRARIIRFRRRSRRACAGALRARSGRCPAGAGSRWHGGKTGANRSDHGPLRVVTPAACAPSWPARFVRAFSPAQREIRLADTPISARLAGNESENFRAELPEPPDSPPGATARSRPATAGLNRPRSGATTRAATRPRSRPARHRVPGREGQRTRSRRGTAQRPARRSVARPARWRGTPGLGSGAAPGPPRRAQPRRRTTTSGECGAARARR